MRIPIYQVDAFTDRLFAGNPAAVCPLKEWLPAETMQAIAAENNLAETAFFVAEGEGYLLRWFTPTVEVELCGHATLASGYVVTRILEPARKTVSFHTVTAGTLTVARDGERLVMDFPSRPAVPKSADPGVIAALGKEPVETLAQGHHVLAVYERAQDVTGIKPDFGALRSIGGVSVIVTAPGTDGVDFVSRFFAPNHGIDEDPVTGGAHCVLTPYWARRLGKSRLRARQVSARGGDLVCELKGDRVALAGNATLYLEGTITV
jgi:PhzF family phenazine biosynthesis protein